MSDFTIEEAREIWECSYIFEWEDQLERYGYVVFDEEEDYETPAAWMAKLCEWRWTPPQFTNWLPSRMWDKATPSQGGLQLTAVGMAYSKQEMETILDDVEATDRYNEFAIDDEDDWVDDFIENSEECDV